MAKSPSSIIGVDIGRYSLKAVLMQRRGAGRFAITHYGSHVPDEPAANPEALTRQIKALMKDLGASGRCAAVSVSSADTLLRIIEQPQTPVHLLRDALRLNGMSLLNQDCRAFVLDCDLIPGAHPVAPEPGIAPRHNYLVAGLPRVEVQRVGAGVEGASIAVQTMQLAPVSVFNAFEFARPEIFNNEAFFLVDIGHTASTMMVGAKRELILVRTIDFGGRGLIEALCGLSGEGREAVIEALEQEDEVMVEYTRVATNTLTREIGSSIGFFEARHDSAIGRVFFSGGPAKSRTFLKIMSDEVGMPCESWAAAERCENAVASSRRDDFEREMLDLNVACGAAAEALKER
jgi:Tfp pilus assembly PilM family ATPase